MFIFLIGKKGWLNGKYLVTLVYRRITGHRAFKVLPVATNLDSSVSLSFVVTQCVKSCTICKKHTRLREKQPKDNRK